MLQPERENRSQLRDDLLLEIEQRSKYRKELGNMAIAVLVAATLAKAAFGTVEHAALFGFLVYAVYSNGNRVTRDLRLFRAAYEADRLRDGKKLP